ncbi:MAG TPA: YggS family pyridoxal phosphate-dependent enzyme [Longimicrobiales bacterium]|nr:YggS family pyridoxal phosphate-dependent enzyme [Longimicrobiales bacterium]
MIEDTMTTAQATAEVYAARLEHTLPQLRERVERAAAASARDPGSVRVVAVTKSHPLEAVDAALAAGLHDLGENRVEELEEKRRARPDTAAHWHLIGHVQTRKARRAAELSDLLHSLDSLRLAEKLSRVVTEQDREVAVLAQVNTSGEGSKGGFELDGAVEAIHELSELPGLRVEGLMTMAPFVDDERVLRSAFALLRETGERLRRITQRVGPELSMGMTNDLDVAIREGSTLIRLGTALFGERPGT